ncbi:hypothetical protein BDN70DRAFT_901630, partial [Pholiota conissans]
MDGDGTDRRRRRHGRTATTTRTDSNNDTDGRRGRRGQTTTTTRADDDDDVDRQRRRRRGQAAYSIHKRRTTADSDSMDKRESGDESRRGWAGTMTRTCRENNDEDENGEDNNDERRQRRRRCGQVADNNNELNRRRTTMAWTSASDGGRGKAGGRATSCDADGRGRTTLNGICPAHHSQPKWLIHQQGYIAQGLSKGICKPMPEAAGRFCDGWKWWRGCALAVEGSERRAGVEDVAKY